MGESKPSLLMEVIAQQAIFSLPLLIGMLVAIVNLRRYPLPSALLLTAMLLLLMPTIGSACMYSWLIENSPESDAARPLNFRFAVSSAFVAARAIGFTVLFCAIFVRRKPRHSAPQAELASSQGG